MLDRTMVQPGIVHLTRENLPKAAAALGRAFHEDPLQTYVFPDPSIRADRSPAHFAPILEYGLRFGTVLTTEGEPAGAAVWLPPGRAIVTEERAAEAGIDKLPEVLGADEANRFFSVLAAIDPYHQTDVPEDHWYVLVVGVDPGAQGLGLGRKLLAPMIEEARQQKVPCYLETAQPRNVGFYEHLGFKVMREVVDESSGLRLWTFRLDP